MTLTNKQHIIYLNKEQARRNARQYKTVDSKKRLSFVSITKCFIFLLSVCVLYNKNIERYIKKNFILFSFDEYFDWVLFGAMP